MVIQEKPRPLLHPLHHLGADIPESQRRRGKDMTHPLITVKAMPITCHTHPGNITIDEVTPPISLVPT